MVHLAVIHRAMAAVSGVGAMVLRGRCGSLAMGGTATALLVGLAAPRDVPVAWAQELADGLRDEAAVVGAVVVGGDTVSSDQVVVSAARPRPPAGGRPGRSPC